jgi:hypothetical protein
VIPNAVSYRLWLRARRRPGRGGSHVIFSAPGVREIVSVPAKRPIKPVYVKQFVALIDAVGGISTK